MTSPVKTPNGSSEQQPSCEGEKLKELKGPERDYSTILQGILLCVVAVHLSVFIALFVSIQRRVDSLNARISQCDRDLMIANKFFETLLFNEPQPNANRMGFNRIRNGNSRGRHQDDKRDVSESDVSEPVGNLLKVLEKLQFRTARVTCRQEVGKVLKQLSDVTLHARQDVQERIDQWMSNVSLDEGGRDKRLAADELSDIFTEMANAERAVFERYSSNASKIVLLGEKGEPGPKGDMGLQVLKGESGHKGDEGMQGLKGDPAIQGLPEIKGDTGLTGDKVPPRASIQPTMIPLTSTLFFNCQTSGDQPLQVTWAKNGERLDLSNATKYVQLPPRGTGLHRLLLISASENDTGTYQCADENGIGSQTSVSYVYKDLGTVNCSSTFSMCTANLCGAACPDSCQETNDLVYGSGLYSIESSICRTAVHAGTLGTGVVGTVVWKSRPSDMHYTASTQHGITSLTVCQTPTYLHISWERGPSATHVNSPSLNTLTNLGLCTTRLA